MMVLDVMIVSVALPSLQRELHLSPAGLECVWLVRLFMPRGGAGGGRAR
jgi:hypothetical protein